MHDVIITCEVEEGDRLPTICQHITVRWQHNRTIGKLSVWNNRSNCPPIVRLSADTIVRWDYRP